MVELLNCLRQQVLSLLEQRDEHPGLQKILDITNMLLGLPPSTSVAQVKQPCLCYSFCFFYGCKHPSHCKLNERELLDVEMICDFELVNMF